MVETRTSLCRLCTAFCPIVVTVEDGRAVSVAGNHDAPLYGGYTCPKGRALPEQHYGDARLLRPLRRDAAGVFQTIESKVALDEIAERLRTIVDEYGPRSVAVYAGMGAVPFIASYSIASGWLNALGSKMFFTAGSIDKPGILIALAMHGMWQGGQPPVENADAWLFVGINPVISKSPGFPGQNPGRILKALTEDGANLIVIDPRRSETAKRAKIHLQPRPGEDAVLLAAMIRLILADKLYDEAFVCENAIGIEALRAAVEPYTIDYAAQRADVPADALAEAARMFALARHSGVSCGTGPSFATHSTLTEYLSLCLMTLCGRWSRAGDKLTKPNVLLPAYEARAQPWPPFQGWGYEPRLRVRGLGGCASGLSAAALADEILMPGEGTVRALIVCGGNPMMAWPDQTKAYAALKDLDLLVTIDTEMTATAELSDYVMSPKLTLETPMTTYMAESVKYYGTNRGYDQPYAAYTPAIVDPPADSDLLEDWEFFWELAQRLGFKIPVTQRFGNGPQAEHAPVMFDLDPTGPKPTTDQIIDAAHRVSRVPVDIVRQYPHGSLFESDQCVLPREAGNTDVLELGAEMMMSELAQVFTEDTRAIESEYPFRLVPRRLNNMLNSFGRRTPQLARKTYNPAYLHPQDMCMLGVSSGDEVDIASRHGQIRGIAEADASVRRGVVSMSHGFGRNPGADNPRESGANTGRLLSAEVEYDPITGIPRMGAVPVRITARSKALA